MTPDAFDTALRARGIELILRRQRLHVWPARAYRLGLTDAERDYIAAHRDELKALVLAGRPQTIVQWQEPGRAAPAPVAPDPTIAADATLRAENLEAWLVLHGNDAEALTIRGQQAADEMRASMRRAERR